MSSGSGSVNCPVGGEGTGKWFPVILIVLLVGLVFLPALNNGFVNWDDPPYVLDNYSIRSLHPTALAALFTRPQSSYYSPLVFLSFALDFHLWELNPFGYHLTNVLLHLANSLLLLIFLRRLTGRPWVALLATLFFALNPLRVESVAWVTERKDVLSGCFYLLALIWYLGSRGPGRPVLNRGYWLSLAAAAAALLSKPVAVTIVPVLWLVDYYLLRNGRCRLRPFSPSLIANKIPFIIFSLLLGWVALSLQGSAGTVRAGFYLDPLPHILVAVRNFWFYILKTIFPWNLSAYYAYPRFFSLFLPEFFLPLLALVSLLLLLISRVGRSPDLIWGVGFYTLTVLPALQVVPIGNVIFADRFSYLPSVGLSFLLALFLLRIAGPGRRRVVGIVLTGLSILSWGILTFLRCGVWRDSVTLWTDVLEKSPEIATAHLNLGEVYLKEGRLNEAVVAFRRARELDPESANIYTNLGDTYQKLDRFDEAEVELLTALEIDPENPIAYNNLGINYVRQGRREEAREAFVAALLWKEDYPEALNNLGLIYQGEGRMNEAIASFQKAVTINTLYRDGHHNLASAYLQVGELARAVQHYRRAVELQPEFAPALTDLGFAWARMGRWGEAGAVLERASVLNPESGLTYYGLALCHYFQGDISAAVRYRDRALEFGFREIPADIMELKYE